MLKLTAADIADLPTRSQYISAPQFPAELVAKNGYTPEQQYDAAVYALKSLRAYVKRAIRWQIACTRYSRGEGPAPKLSSLPSKASGKQSYDKSAQLSIWLGWDREATRCHALIDQVELVLAAQEILGR